MKHYSVFARKRGIDVLGKIPLFFICFCLICSHAQATLVVNDGFHPSGTIESQYFSIQYTPQVEIPILTQHLNVSATDRFLAGEHIVANNTPSQELAKATDALFLMAMNTLDMPVYNFKGIIKIVPTHEELKQVYYNLYQRNDLPDTGYSFYIYEINTIYISTEYFRKEILGHEMAHAVISHYFVVQPSMKVQEVLAGYIEYQLRKNR